MVGPQVAKIAISIYLMSCISQKCVIIGAYILMQERRRDRLCLFNSRTAHSNDDECCQMSSKLKLVQTTVSPLARSHDARAALIKIAAVFSPATLGAIRCCGGAPRDRLQATQSTCGWAR